MRRHFFLVGAIAVLALLLAGGAVRLMFPAHPPGAAGPGGPGGGAQTASAKGKAGPGGPGAGGGAGRPAVVTPVVAAVRPFADRIEVLGVAKGRQSVTITSNTTELITRVHFRDGEAVSRGTVLVDLQASEEDADITVAQAALTEAKRQYDRWRSLADQGIAPRATAEQYEAAYDQARANVKAAQSRLADRVIRAPFSGVVGLSDIAPGSLINPGSTIATLDDVSLIRVDFDVPDRYLKDLSQGQTIIARPDALQGETFTGRIAMLNTRVDERTRSIRGRAEIPNPGRRLKPGMMVRVGIERSQRQSVAVPESAVLFEGDNPSVFVIGPKLVAEQRPVTVGVNQDGFVEIRSGLQSGEKVVADGLNRVQAGQHLKIVGAPGRGAAAHAPAEGVAEKPAKA